MAQIVEPETFTLTLTKPITITRTAPGSLPVEETITSVTIREPDTGDLAVTDKVEGDVSKGILLVSHLSDLPVVAIRKLRPSDFNKLAEKASDF